MQMGGYRNEGKLTEEHEKLPEALRRRVGKKIKVTRVTDDLVSYINTGGGFGQTFKKTSDGRWVHSKTWISKEGKEKT